MKSRPETSDHRTNADNSLRRARKLPPGREKQSLLDQAEDDEAQAHSSDWRHSHLYAPD
jgi:hypothetical protein